jgi:hypothetical protein
MTERGKVMKILNIYRLCFVGMLIVAMMVAWSTAMPSHMSHDRLAIIVGCPGPCIAKAATQENTQCSEYGDCTGLHTFAYGTDFNSERFIAFKNTGKCSGDSECNWIQSSVYHFDCYLN